MTSQRQNPLDDDLDDDRPIGRVLSRREVLILMAAAGGAVIAGCAPASLQSGAAAGARATATPALNPGVSAEKATAEAMSADPAIAATGEAEVAAVDAANAVLEANCVVRPELTEGPYFVDGQMERSDIRVEPTDGSIKAGLPLALAFVISQVSNNACTPLEGATVDVWHCDYEGVYSDVTDRSFDTTGETWLRGYQVTGADGRAEFKTNYPGWYSGRAVHIHFKVRTPGPDGNTWDFTSQLFFPEEVTAQVFGKEPYAAKGLADTPNASDSIYRNGGDQLVLNLTPADDGLATVFRLALDI